jgi:hypothetical protein
MWDEAVDLLILAGAIADLPQAQRAISPSCLTTMSLPKNQQARSRFASHLAQGMLRWRKLGELG